jgi:Acetyltransferase (GNAT) domain
MTIQVRRAETSDRPALSRLFASVFGSPRSPLEWEWKYDRNPSTAASVGAFDDGEAIGFFGGFATRFVGGGIDLPGVSGVDVMTSPAARRLGRHGVYREMGLRFVEENRALGIPFYFGFPNDRHRIAGEKILGFRTVERAGAWIRPAGAPLFLRRLRGRLQPVRRIDSFSASHDPLSDLLRTRPGLLTDRSRTVLNWRFAGRPDVSYLLLEATRATRASRGYAVLRFVGDRALVVDLQVVDESGGTVVDLLDAVGSVGSEHGARTVELRASRRGPLAARMAELGFTEAPSDTCLELILVDPAYPIERAMEVFDYRYSDHDVF